MAAIPSIPIPFLKSGIIRTAAIDEVLSPQDSVEFALNVHFDRLGAVELRKGLTLLGSQIGGSAILGLGAYRNNARTTFAALANMDGSVYSYTGSSWSAVRSALTSTSKARYTNFVDYIFMANGNQAISTYNGSGSFGSINVADLPSGADFIENYRSRVWAAVASSDKLYYSDVVTTSNTITGGTSFIQVSPQDGDKITGLKRHPRALLVFKNNYIYRVFSINSTDPDPSIFRGTYSQESIIEGKNGISYHHPTGFYNFVFDGQQEEISRPIIDIVRAIPRSYYENISGWSDDDHKFWSIGDITLEGVDFTNVVVRYTISTQVWSIYSYASEPRSSVLYDDGTDLIQLIGDDAGKIFKFDNGTTDNGTAIFYDLQTHWIYFTNIKSNKKTISEIGTLHENANGGNLSYQIDTDTPNKWRPIGSLQKDLYQVDKLNAKDFTRIRFRLSGSSSGSPFIFRGWEVLNMVTEGKIKKL